MNPILVNILSIIVALGILIFVHELGHFLFAKLAGVGVETFSLGFGPRLFGFRRGETDYRVSAFPLGGYVKMIGEGDDRELTSEEQRRSFAAKTPLTRIVIVAAGPVFNIVFAFVVYIFVFMHGIPVQTALVGGVEPTMPAAKAGIRGGDVITAVNGKPVRYWNEMAQQVMEVKGGELTVSVTRNGQEKTFTLTPVMTKEKSLLDEE
ncbi:MAG TPA: RIP metalloprotease RseP, partial [Geobacterales bacterium]|nr:RIP metalloprotease RseP [Geobacterales bacterium]